MGRAELPELGEHRVVVPLPAIDQDDLVAACELLWQEGHRLWSLGIEELDAAATLTRVFGRRARFGVHGLQSAAQARAAAAAGPAFLASQYCLPELVAAADGLPVMLGGLTPQELRTAHLAGASAVQVVPCEAFGTAYARSLPELLPDIPLVATGRLEHYQAEVWLSAGAIAVWPTNLFDWRLVVDVDLSALRVLCQRWQFGLG